LQANLTKNSSPEIFHWYAGFKKRAGANTSDGNYRGAMSVDAEELREQLGIV